MLWRRSAEVIWVESTYTLLKKGVSTIVREEFDVASSHAARSGVSQHRETYWEIRGMFHSDRLRFQPVPVTLYLLPSRDVYIPETGSCSARTNRNLVQHIYLYFSPSYSKDHTSSYSCKLYNGDLHDTLHKYPCTTEASRVQAILIWTYGNRLKRSKDHHRSAHRSIARTILCSTSSYGEVTMHGLMW